MKPYYEDDLVPEEGAALRDLTVLALETGADVMRQLTEWAGMYGGLPQTLQDRADTWRLDVAGALLSRKIE